MKPQFVNPLAFDATRLRPAALCWRKALYGAVYGLERRSLFEVHLDFGKALHAALEQYDRALAVGAKKDKAIETAICKALAESAGWPAEDASEHDAKKNRRTLVRLVCWYADWTGADVLQTVKMTNGAPAIEVPFDLRLSNGAVLCSKPDALVEFEPGELWVRERKTTGGSLDSRYDAQWSPNLQIDIQALIGQTLVAQQHRDKWHFRGVVLEAMQIGVTFARFSRSFHSRTAAQLASIMKKMISLTAEFMKRTRSGQVPMLDNHATLDAEWPMNTAACGADYGCPFRRICAVDPADRMRVIAVDFKQRETPWNPLEHRGRS